MKIPALQGVIRRRILLNYRVEPEVVKKLLPSKFQPKLVKGYSIAGICLIRLEQIRPKGLPDFVGVTSENSAHRIAVEWEDEDGEPREGVFVPRRDTSSRLNALAGGRLFPGVHHHSNFTVADAAGLISLRVFARDQARPLVDLEASETEAFPDSSIFGSLAESSGFFESGSIGYSSRPDSNLLDGLLLKVSRWQVSPLQIHRIGSTFYEDRSMFPAGTIEFDHALLMRDISHEWHSESLMTLPTE